MKRTHSWILLAFFIVTKHCLVGDLTVFGQPNVVVIYTDDQGSVDAGCYGSDIETPHIDKLAKTGVRFTQMLAPSAICSASRAGLLTGKFPAAAGVPSNVSSLKGKVGMPGDELTMAELFKANGYATGHIGKWHLGYTPETMPNQQGFDYSFGHMGGCIDNYSHFFYWNGPNRHDLWKNGKEIFRDGEYFGDMMVEEINAFIDRQTNTKPFFIYWAINWPHYPLQGTSKWRVKYKDWPHPRNKYAMFMSTTDELVGRVVDYIESKGLREDTIILFQSDHGHSVEERTFGGGGSAGPYRGHKGNLFEGGIRVPSVISWPAGLPQDVVRNQMVCGIDWFPTFAELAGLKPSGDHNVHGKSIVEVMKSDAPSPHKSLYWQLGNNPAKSKWVVREGSWKLLGNTTENVRPEGVEALTGSDRKHFLVDLSKDLGEKVNVAEENPEVVKRLLELKTEYDAEIATHQ